MKKLTLFVMLAGALAAAQTPGATPDKPAVPALTAERVFEKYVDAIGGRERIAKIRTIVEKSTSRSGRDTMTSATYFKAPRKYASTREDRKGVKTGIGFDDQTAWLLWPEKYRGHGIWFTDWPPPDTSIPAYFHIHAYKNAKLLGVKKVNHRRAYVVELSQEETAQGAYHWTYYLDIDTFLLLRLDVGKRPEPQLLVSAIENRDLAAIAVAALAAHSHDVTYYYSDWRSVAGLQVPFEIKAKLPFTSIEGSVTKILDTQIDANLDDSAFLPPSGSAIIPAPQKTEPN